MVEAFSSSSFFFFCRRCKVMPTDSPLKNSSVVLRGSKVQEPLPQKFNATLKQHQSIHSGPLNKMQIYAL